MKFKTPIWKQSKARYETGQNLFIGNLHVGGWRWNDIDRDEKIRYIAFCLLPGVADLGKFQTQETAKEIVTGAVALWLDHLLEK